MVKHNEQVSDDPNNRDPQLEKKDLVADLLWKHDLFVTLLARHELRPTYGHPTDYDGGELVIDFSTGDRSIKLPAGSAVLYPATALHRVTEVTRGQRQAWTIGGGPS